VRPGGIIQRGSISGRGGDSPLGNGDPVSICVKIQAHHHSNTGTSVSQPPSRHCFQVFFEQFFRGFLGPIYDLKTLRVTVLLMTLIVNHFGLADCRIDVNRRKRGRAHPQYTCRAGQKRFSRKSGHFRQAVYCSSNIPGSSQLVIKIQKLMLRVRLVKQPVIYRLPFHGPIHADRWQKRKACQVQKRVIALWYILCLNPMISVVWFLGCWFYAFLI
jgi:hypothetical protein